MVGNFCLRFFERCLPSSAKFEVKSILLLYPFHAKNWAVNVTSRLFFNTSICGNQGWTIYHVYLCLNQHIDTGEKLPQVEDNWSRIRGGDHLHPPKLLGPCVNKIWPHNTIQPQFHQKIYEITLTKYILVEVLEPGQVIICKDIAEQFVKLDPFTIQT